MFSGDEISGASCRARNGAEDRCCFVEVDNTTISGLHHDGGGLVCCQFESETRQWALRDCHRNAPNPSHEMGRHAVEVPLLPRPKSSLQ